MVAWLRQPVVLTVVVFPVKQVTVAQNGGSLGNTGLEAARPKVVESRVSFAKNAALP